MKLRFQTVAIVFLITSLACNISPLFTELTWNSQTITEAASSSTNTVPPTIEWNQTFGVGYYNTAYCIIQTSDGGYAVTGMYGDSSAPLRCMLVKMDSKGNVLWNQSYDLRFINSPMNTALLQTSDGGYAIVGNDINNVDIKLIKTDQEGKQQWNQTYTNFNQETIYGIAWGMTQTSDGGYIIIGSRAFSLEPEIVEPNLLLIKTNSAGEVQWSRCYEEFEGGNCRCIIQADDGTYVLPINGLFYRGEKENRCWIVKIDSSGNMINNVTYSPPPPQSNQQVYSTIDIYSLIQTSDGGYVLAGNTFRQTDYPGESRGLLMKTDSSGNMVWNRTYGETKEDVIYSVIQTSDGGFALAGKTPAFTEPRASNKYSGMWLIKTDEDGNKQWTQVFGGTRDSGADTDIAFDVIETSDGAFALAGKNNPGTVSNGGYYYIIKTTPVLPPHTQEIFQTSTALWVIGSAILIVTVAFLVVFTFKRKHKKQPS